MKIVETKMPSGFTFQQEMHYGQINADIGFQNQVEC